MLRKQREKGARWERAVRDLFREIMPQRAADITRCFQYRGDGDPDVRTPWFHVECKSGKQAKIRSALNQAISDAEVADELMPIVVGKIDRTEPFVMLRLSDFLHLVKVLWDHPETHQKLLLRGPREEQ